RIAASRNGMPKAAATALNVTPAHPTSASSNMSAEHALRPLPPVAGWSPASTRAFPVSILHVMFGLTRPLAVSVTMPSQVARDTALSVALATIVTRRQSLLHFHVLRRDFQNLNK